MDVIGNNIANVNTVAYKSQAMNFSDLLYQTTQSASGPNNETGRGGINARQIGLGAKTAAIGTTISQAGSAQTTNNPFDIYITGKSFFVVSDGSTNYFTRDGSFAVDAAGNLVMSSNGYNVMGWQTDPKDETLIVKDTVTPLRVMSAENMTYPAEATSAAYMSGIIDKYDDNVTGDGKIVNMKIYDNLGYSYTAKYNISRTDAGTSGQYNTYKMVLTDVLDSNGLSITKKMKDDGTTEDSGLALPTLSVVSRASATADPTIGASAGQTLYLYYNTNDGSYAGISASETETTAANLTPNKSFLLDFANVKGATVKDPNPGPTAGTNEVNFADIEVDMSSTSNVNNDGTSTISATPGDLKGLNRGRKVGEMTGVSISNAGLIYATYDNGQSKLLGQIAAAQFANAEGLEKAGDNLYQATQNSGEFDGIGVDVTADGGYFTTGELEMSNVDLSNELTTMIVTQRGFQANSRIITVSDTLLEELTNLKR